MKYLVALSACALLAASAPALAQNNSNPSMKKELQRNASPVGVSPSHAKEKGAPDTESGKMTEGRSSATDQNSGMNQGKTGSATSTPNSANSGNTNK